MKKVHYWHGGTEIILGNYKSLWHFRVGDEIICEYDPSESIRINGRSLVIEGFGLLPGREFAIWARPVERKRGFWLYAFRGLILQSRIGMKFRVGEPVMDSTESMIFGQVVVIRPERYIRLPYLVRFQNVSNGENANKQWSMPWFPEKVKDPDGDGYVWCSEDMLRQTCVEEDRT